MLHECSKLQLTILYFGVELYTGSQYCTVRRLRPPTTISAFPVRSCYRIIHASFTKKRQFYHKLIEILANASLDPFSRHSTSMHP